VITVAVFVDGEPVMVRKAKNVGTLSRADGFLQDDGSLLIHKHGDSLKDLATRMLESIEDPTDAKQHTLDLG